jgi:hypothetical protein
MQTKVESDRDHDNILIPGTRHSNPILAENAVKENCLSLTVDV